MNLGHKEAWKKGLADGAVWLKGDQHAAWLARTAKVAQEEGTTDTDAAAAKAMAMYRACTPPHLWTLIAPCDS